ncbi:U-scoloptoxin(01)-Cw1a-like [Macrobrachium nipponense]|uniref:U-scoloptoxin(01)-Cw1a-like n=1 Tax=Macrobrachium nipponense TaxID=159736 RepID=UPI0030C81EDE
MRTFVVVCALVGVAVALKGLRQRRDSSSIFFDLPSNASLVLGGIQTGFSCDDLPYGYYADEANDCAVFHVCLPYIDHDLFVVRHFSFFCGAGTVFNQEKLVCDYPEFALPCSEAASYRSSNGYFGSEVNFLEK